MFIYVQLFKKNVLMRFESELYDSFVKKLKTHFFQKNQEIFLLNQKLLLKKLRRVRCHNYSKHGHPKQFLN